MNYPPVQDQINHINVYLKKTIDNLKQETNDRLYERDGYRKAIAQLDDRLKKIEKMNVVQDKDVTRLLPTSKL